MSEESVHVQLKQQRDYQFDIQFGAGIPAVMGDELAASVSVTVVDALGVKLK